MAADSETPSYEAQIRALSDALPASVFIIDPSGQFLFVNPFWSHFTGLSSEQAAGTGWIEVVHPDDLPAALEAWLKARSSGSAFTAEVRCRSAEGGWVWILARFAPILGPGGKLAAWIGVSSDIDERRRSEEESRRRQARFEALVRASATIVFELDEAGHRRIPNPAWRDYVGAAFDRSPEQAWTVAIHPDDRDAAMAEWRAAFAEKRPAIAEVRQWHEPSRSYRWVSIYTVPVIAADGSAPEWIGGLTDIHEKKIAAETQNTLVLELQHRVRNSLAVVRSLSVQTGRHATGVADFMHRFDGRLTALAHAQSLLTSSNANAADLLDVITTVLQPFRSQYGSAFSIAGPRVQLGPITVTNLSLALHELATNAAKYGALAQPQGRIAVGWTDERGMVQLVWAETGGPPTAPPTALGFGSRLLSQTLSHEPDGAVIQDYRPEGLRCTMRWRAPVCPAQVEAIAS
jgi:PAS domain S-box-containing protein